MDLEKQKWDSYFEDFEGWERMYRLYADIGKVGDLLGVLALVDQIQMATEHYKIYGQEQYDHFLAQLARLKADYDPDNDVKKLEDTLLCLELSPDSHLYEKYGSQICGKYMGMDEKPYLTKIRNKETGKYEDKKGTIVINLAYPTAQDLLKVTYQDTGRKIQTF